MDINKLLRMARWVNGMRSKYKLCGIRRKTFLRDNMATENMRHGVYVNLRTTMDVPT